VLDVAHLRIDLGHRVLLEGASFRLNAGEKVALVGPNGAGKTTLLKTLAREMPPAGGVVNLPEHWGWLRQDVTARVEESSKLAYDHLLDASPLTAMADEMLEAQARIEKAGIDLGAGMDGAEDRLDKAVRRFTNLEEQFRHAGGYSRESEAERLAAGVGLDDDALLREVGTLSGGQRRRLELARLLFRGGDLLILDEPTNHLDADAKNWVMNFLRTTPATVLVVSHDISLMDSAIDRVLALENARIEQYVGTYTKFLVQREEREALRAREQMNFDKEISRLERSKDKFRGANATHAKKRAALTMRIEQMTKSRGPEALVVKRRKIEIKFPQPVRAGDIVLRVEGLAKSFDGTQIFEDIDFLVERGKTFLILGLNGAGKTTLLRTIAGKYQADAGEVKLGANVTLGFYAQEHEDIRHGVPVINHLREAGQGITDPELRKMLGHFGMTGSVADQDAGTLSGGEKTKLALARLMISKANVLFLDEPTNNLDPPSVEAVLAALQHYQGTIVLVSHDEDFVTQLAPDKVIVMPEGEELHFDEEVLDLIGMA
jgi:ATPase subunit of ABC transporter with duplicated ATPase domains